jgi:hypothetical protein
MPVAWTGSDGSGPLSEVTTNRVLASSPRLSTWAISRPMADYPQRPRPLGPRRAQGGPAAVEAAPVAVGIGLGRLDRDVHRLKGQIGEPGLLARRVFVDVAGQAVDQQV